MLAQAMTGNPSFPLRQVMAMLLQILNAGCRMHQDLLFTYPLNDCVPSLLLPMPLRQYTAHLVAHCYLRQGSGKHSAHVPGLSHYVLPAGQPALSKEAQQQAAVALCDALKHTQHALAATAAAALGCAGLRGPLPLPDAPTPAAASPPEKPQSSSDAATEAKQSNLPPQENSSALPSSTSTVSGTEAESSGPACDDVASRQSAMQRIVALTKDKDVKVVQKAAIAAGHCCAGHPVKAVLDPALEALFALGFNKNEDVLFTVGEALCFAFGGTVSHLPRPHDRQYCASQLHTKVMHTLLKHHLERQCHCDQLHRGQQMHKCTASNDAFISLRPNIQQQHHGNYHLQVSLQVQGSRCLLTLCCAPPSTPLPPGSTPRKLAPCQRLSRVCRIWTQTLLPPHHT